MEAKVLFDYDKQQDDELDLKVDMVIKNVIQVDDGWCEGTTEDGRTGMFPDNFVQLIPVSSQPSVPKQSRPPPPDPTPSEPPVITRPADSRSKSRRAKVTFSYAAENPDELTLQPGEFVEVIGEEEDGWWKGKIGDRSGLFPSNFVEMLQDEQPSPSHPPLPTSHPPHPSPSHPPHPTTSHPPQPIPSTQPPQPSPAGHMATQDRTDGPPPPEKRAGGPIGPQMFPTGFNPAAVRLKRAVPPPAPPKEKEEIKMPQLKKPPPQPPKPHEKHPPPPVPQESQVERAKVIYAYNSEHDDELTIQVGDVLEVVDKHIQDGWWEVRLGGKTGLVPDNFVELLPSSQRPPAPAPAKETTPPLRPPIELPPKKDVKRPVPPVQSQEEKADFGVPSTTPLDSTVLKSRPPKPVGSRPPSRSNLLEEMKGEPKEESNVAPWLLEMRNRKAKATPPPKPEERKPPPPKPVAKPPPPATEKPRLSTKPSVEPKSPAHPPASSTTSDPSAVKLPVQKHPPPKPSAAPEEAEKEGAWKEEFEKLREEFQQFKEKIQQEVRILGEDLDRERKENAILRIDIDRLKKTRL